MARARNIKPGFFKNEDLAECTPWARLCFAGLWTLADREGRLEDRAKRIKGELFPYDTVEVEPLLVELARWGFIKRYEVNGERYILIAKFVEHQAPHGTEKDGSIPDENGFLTVHERGKNGYITGNYRLEQHCKTVKQADSTASDNSALTVKGSSPDGGQNPLIPDSLIPDSLNTPLTPQGGRRRRRSEADSLAAMPGFDVFYAAYPRKVGKQAALKAWLKLAPDEALQVTILGALAAQRPHLDRRENGRFIAHPATWLNDGRWDDEIPGAKVSAPVNAGGELWWQAAGFDSVAHAENERCHVGNYRDFRDGRRIAEGAAA